MILSGHGIEECEEEVVVISKHDMVSNPVSIEMQSQAYLRVQSSVSSKCRNPLVPYRASIKADWFDNTWKIDEKGARTVEIGS